MNPANADLERLRAEYADRAVRLAGSDIYSPFNTANLFTRQQRQRTELALLNRYGFDKLSDRRVLEIGCGRGGILHDYLGYGAAPQRLNGIELLFDSISEARRRQPHLPLLCGDGQQLPFQNGSFDLVLQYTVFSSILDEGVRSNMAREMLRVLRNPGGLIIWYDFWLNPSNRQTRGIRPKEVKRLFPRCRFEFHRITLAPPIARRLVAVSWTAALLLEKLRLFNSHYLVAIEPLP